MLRAGRAARAWRPSHAAALYYNVAFRRRNELRRFDDRHHLEAAAGWLARAQDATGDGGIAGRYRLDRGWTASYPETTGYIIPTFLALESEGGLVGFRDRARRCAEFLLGVQLESGAFPGLEITENRERPSVFNTAQILNGLVAWHRASGDDRALAAAHRAANWLVDTQDADGAWRVHLYGSGRPYTYMAHAGCWLAEFGEYVGHDRSLRAAGRHLEWVLGHVDEKTGWIDDCGFEEDQAARRAVTHTIAYTIWGVLLTSRILNHTRGLDVARTAATAIARRLELSRWLPGKLDANWKGAAPFGCMTGNAQMALIWLEFHRLESDPTLLSAACKALDLVKRAQPMMSSNPGILGGIPGSDPIWGDYITLAFPNWAPKFFIDALMAKRRALQSITALPIAARGLSETPPADVPAALPHAKPAAKADPVRVVLLTAESSTKAVQFCESWKGWGFAPAAVVIQRSPTISRWKRAEKFLSDFGALNLARRALDASERHEHRDGEPATRAPAPQDVTRYCADRNIPVVYVDSIESPSALAELRALQPDVFIHAGCGIMRSSSLSIPRLGTLNAHMGVLPRVRGMNAAEWSAFCGLPIGATVHLIDAGIDTGDILLCRAIDVARTESVAALRDEVDRTQVALLGDVTRWIITHGMLPPRRAQRADEGRQFFAMHSELRQLLDTALHRGTLRLGGRPDALPALEPA